MKHNNLSATAIPDFVYTANATLEEIGDSPLYTLSLPRLEAVMKKWIWEMNQPQAQPAAKPEPEKYLTRNDVSVILRLSLPTVDKYCQEGILPSVRVGRRILFRPSDIQKSIDSVNQRKWK